MQNDDQLGMFNERTAAVMSPDLLRGCQKHSTTSRKAAESVSDATVTKRAEDIIALVKRTGGVTDEQMQTLLGMNGNSQRPVRVGLVKLGLLRDSGRTRKTISGREATVWEAA